MLLNHSTLRWPRDMVALFCFLLLGRWGGQQGASCFVGGHSNRSSQIGFHWRIMENRLQTMFFQMMWLVTLVTGSPFVAPEWWKNLPSFPRQFSRQFSWQFSVWSQWSQVTASITGINKLGGRMNQLQAQWVARMMEPAMEQYWDKTDVFKTTIQNHIKRVPSNPDVAPHLKRIIIIIIFMVLDREWWNDPKDPIHILNLSS